MEKRLILATSSPYRVKAFSSLKIPFEAIESEVDENFEGRPKSPGQMVLHLAKLKAEAVAKLHYQEPRIVIGFDSVGFFRDRILEKPKSREDAFARLQAISGDFYQFFTGIYLIDILSDGRRIYKEKLERTEVKLRYYSDAEIEKYLDQDSKFMTYAQGFDPLQGYGSTYVEWISGCYNNLLHGIPLAAVVGLIRRTGYLKNEVGR